VILMPMKNLGEAVGKLLFRMDGKETKQISLHLFMNNVAADVKVLWALMEALVVSDVVSGFVVTK